MHHIAPRPTISSNIRSETMPICPCTFRNKGLSNPKIVKIIFKCLVWRYDGCYSNYYTESEAGGEGAIISHSATVKIILIIDD